MAINRTPKKAEENNDGFFVDPIAQVFEDVDHEFDGRGKDTSNVSEDKYDALAKQLADLQTRLSESEKANMALITQPQFRSQVTEPQEVKPESIALPDPALDPDGFDRAQAQRNQIRWDNQQRRADFQKRKSKEQDDKIDDLWDAFADAHPELAEDKERVEYISVKLAKQAAKRGLDVERYMFTTRDKFISDVAKEYENFFGLPEAGDDDEDTTSQSRGRQADRGSRARSRNRNRQEEDYVVRTGGVFGGNESGGRPSKGREAADDGASMIDDLYAIQKKSGFY